MDRRVRKTQSAIMETFLNLLSAKGFEQITINDIADAADVNRSTVYFHYADKYDLYEKCIETYLDHIFIGCQSDSPDSLLFHTFFYIREEKETFQLFLQNNNSGIFHTLLMERIQNNSRYNLASTDSLKKEMQQQFLVSATTGIFEWCIKNVDKYIVEEVMQRYKDMVIEYNIVHKFSP